MNRNILPTQATINAYDNWRDEIRKRMKEQRLSVSSLGRRVDMSTRSISRYLNGSQYPNLAVVITICEAVGMKELHLSFSYEGEEA